MSSDIDKIFKQTIRDSVDHHILESRYEYDFANKKVLEIAPDEHDGAHNTFMNADIEILNITPGAHIEADICEYIPRPEKYYNVILCMEVLEHTANPFDAMKQLHRVLKTGGHLYFSTPFMFRIHNPLPDNWRFTEHGLRELCKDFREVEIERVGRDELAPIHYRIKAKK